VKPTDAVQAAQHFDR